MTDNPFLAGIEREGALRGVHEVILEMLEENFGTVPEEVQQRVRRITDRERLRTLRRNVASSANLQAFLEQFDLATSSTGG